MTSQECYDLDPLHRGGVSVYTDGVFSHPLCDAHAERAGFKPSETLDEMLSRMGLV